MALSQQKAELMVRGEQLVLRWCQLNNITPPDVDRNVGREPHFGTCAYYRDGVIHIWPESCAAIGVAGQAWSYPGYVVDRTPYGVMAHETGHHVERAHGARGGIVASQWRRQTAEQPITGYAENDNEWFAEIFRLFLTNPDLLSRLRPRMFEKLASRWPAFVEIRTWREVLKDVPRQMQAAENKIRRATGRFDGLQDLPLGHVRR